MVHSSKRRLSISSECDHDIKKRKLNSTVAPGPEPPVPHSPVLLPSDSSTTLVDDDDSDSASKDEGKPVDSTPILTESDRPLSPKKRRLPLDGDNSDSAPKDKGKAVDRTPVLTESEVPLSPKKRRLLSDDDTVEDTKRRRLDNVATSDPSSSTSSPSPSRATSTSSASATSASHTSSTLDSDSANAIDAAPSPRKDKGKAVDRSPQPAEPEQPRKDASHKKRSHWSSEDRHLPEDALDVKRRRLDGVATCDPSSSTSGPSRVRVAQSSSVPLVSCSDDGGASSSKDKGKAVDRTPVNPPTPTAHTDAENPVDPANSADTEAPVIPAAVNLEIERLRAQLAMVSELLEQSEDKTKSVLQALTCHVCLEIVSVPYALVPCGHIACHACLVRWFGSSEQAQIDDEEHPDIEWLSDEESEPEDDGPHPAAEPSENEPQTSAEDGHGIDTHADTSDPLPAPPTLPALPPFPNLGRIKTCPHCRCTIVQRPVPAYAIRDILGILGTGPAIPETKTQAKKRSGSDKKTPKDPWSGVFPPDDDHPGGSGGPGSNGTLRIRLPWPSIPPLGSLPVLSPPVLPPLPPLTIPSVYVPSPLPPPLHDEEDGVQRCGVCFHELWHGSCTNTNCNAEYARNPADVEEEEEEDSDDGLAFLARDGHHGVAGDPEGEPEPNEDEYESSFIDDDEDPLPGPSRGHGPRPLGAGTDAAGLESDNEDKEDDDFLPGPSRRYGRNREDPIVISSDEEATSLPRRLSHGSVMLRQLLDEEEDDGEVSGIEADALYEFFVQSGFTSSPPYHPCLEQDDEDYGNEEVPYIWDINNEADDEDEDEDEEKGGYPQGENEDEDGEAPENEEEDNRDGYES